MKLSTATGLLCITVLPGCCFLSCEEQALVMPDATIEVVDPSGTPLEGATVSLARYHQYPHFRGPVNQAKQTTGTDGTTSFEFAEETIRQMPLMMHGVTGFSFQFCVERQGYATRAARWFVDTPRDELGGAVALDTPIQQRVALPSLDDGEDPRDCEQLLGGPLPELAADGSTGAFCVEDADCTYVDLYAGCCPSCLPDVTTTAVARARTETCASAEVTCPAKNCAYEVSEAQPPTCVDGHCQANYDTAPVD